MCFSLAHSQETAPTAEKGASDAEKAVAAAQVKGKATVATIWSPHELRQSRADRFHEAIEDLSGVKVDRSLTPQQRANKQAIQSGAVKPVTLLNLENVGVPYAEIKKRRDSR